MGVKKTVSCKFGQWISQDGSIPTLVNDAMGRMHLLTIPLSPVTQLTAASRIQIGIGTA